VSCPNCDEKLDENQKFCEKCGTECRSVINLIKKMSDHKMSDLILFENGKEMSKKDKKNLKNLNEKMSDQKISELKNLITFMSDPDYFYVRFMPFHGTE